MFISELGRLQPPSVSLNLLDYSLQFRTITVSKCISKLACSWPSSASPNLLDHGLQVHLQTHLIMASKCISKLAWLLPPSVSWSLLDYSLRVHHYVQSRVRGYEGISSHDEEHKLRRSMNAWEQCVRIHINCVDLWRSARVHETNSWEG